MSGDTSCGEDCKWEAGWWFFSWYIFSPESMLMHILLSSTSADETSQPVASSKATFAQCVGYIGNFTGYIIGIAALASLLTVGKLWSHAYVLFISYGRIVVMCAAWFLHIFMRWFERAFQRERRQQC